MSNKSTNFKHINIKTKRKLSNVHSNFSYIAMETFYTFRKFDSFSPQAMFKGNPTSIVLLPKVTIVKEMQTISRKIIFRTIFYIIGHSFSNNTEISTSKLFLIDPPIGRVRSESPMRDTHNFMR